VVLAQVVVIAAAIIGLVGVLSIRRDAARSVA